MLSLVHKSTNILTATLTDSSGSAVAGATVTVTILDLDGTEIVSGAIMVGQGDGTYDYTVANTLLSTPGVRYRAQVTAVSGTSTRYAEVELTSRVDAT